VGQDIQKRRKDPALVDHHIGQPATVLRAHLDMLRRDAQAGPDLDKLNECIQAAESLAGILGKFRQVSAYRTVPYVTYPGTAVEDDEIIDIEPARAKP